MSMQMDILGYLDDSDGHQFLLKTVILQQNDIFA